MARRIVLPLALSLSTACSYSGMDSGAWDSGWGAYAGDAGGGAAYDSGDSEADDYDPEVEDDYSSLSPAPTARYVFVANPDRGTVTRIATADLSVVTTEVGVDPHVVRTTADGNTAVVFNRGTDDLSILNADTLEERRVPVRPDFNQMVMTPDGAWVALFHDAGAREDGDLSDGAWSFNEVSLVNVDTGDHFPMVVGFNPREIQFSDDSARMVVVSDAYLAVVELDAETPTPERIAIAEDTIEPPLAEELLLTPDGTQALVRQFGAPHLLVVGLLDGAVDFVDVGDTPTDLDVTPDGLQAVAVARGTGELWIYDLFDLTATPEVVALPSGEVLGSIVMSPDNETALLYSTASGVSRYASWDRTGAGDAVDVHSSVKPISGVEVSPDGRVALLTHDIENGDTDVDSVFFDEHALTMVELADFFANPIRLPAAPTETAETEDGDLGFVILEAEPRVVQLDFTSLLHDDISLRSPAVHLGVLPGTRSVYISQEHDLGRISFYDADSSELQTITGFELNAGIEVE